MTALGLSIKISKETLIVLQSLHHKEVIVKYNEGWSVEGKLKSFDKSVNLILDNTEKFKIEEGGVKNKVKNNSLLVKMKIRAFWK